MNYANNEKRLQGGDIHNYTNQPSSRMDSKSLKYHLTGIDDSISLSDSQAP